MRRFAYMTGLYALAHLVVDFSCAFLLFYRVYGASGWLSCLFVYNFCAFAMQMPLGILADRLRQNRIFAALGCLLVFASPLAAPEPLLLSGLAGLGNALFHIGAGRDVLCGSRRRFSALGVFVSPGAAGIFLGMLAGKGGGLPQEIVLSVLLVTAAAILFAVPALKEKGRGERPADEAVRRAPGGLTGRLLMMLAFLFLVVCLRSFVGQTLAFPWKGAGHNALFLVVAVVLGKAAGGILADRLGALRVSFVSLILCAGLLLFYRNPICGVAALFFFNMTMPITLGAAARLLPRAPGFAFGLLTFGLFLGLAPLLAGVHNPLVLPYGYMAACIASACLLYYGLRGVRNGA